MQSTEVSETAAETLITEKECSEHEPFTDMHAPSTNTHTPIQIFIMLSKFMLPLAITQMVPDLAEQVVTVRLYCISALVH